jgi:acetyl esterase/lipase
MNKRFFSCLLACTLIASSAMAQSKIPQLNPVTPTGSGITEFPAPPTPPSFAKGKKPQPPEKLRKSPDLSYIQRKYIDIRYGSISPTQTFDLYLPNEGTGPYPVIVDIHGGAFMLKAMTSKSAEELEIVDAGVKHGYAVVSINYRLSGEARFPRAVNDAKAVIRFLRANAERYNLDPNKIVAWGGSAGGNIAALLGTSGAVNDLDGDNTENLQYPSNVQAVVDWFGPCDFLKYDEQFKASGKTTPFGSVFSPNSGETLYIGQPLTQDTAFTERANPETYVPLLCAQNAPYFIIEHGTADLNIPTVQSVNLANRLKKQLGSDKVYLELLPGAVHGDPAFSSQKNLEKVFRLLAAHIK